MNLCVFCFFSQTYNYTVLNRDVNKVLQCIVSTRNPDFMDSVNATLNIEGKYSFVTEWATNNHQFSWSYF